MNKKLLLVITVFTLILQVPTCAFAKSSNISSPVKIAIKKYKRGNYTGCLQDCMNVVVHDPSNALAYYYMAMSYVQAGQKKQAISAYSKVLSLNSNPRLRDYASTGKRCLETPDKCVLQTPGDNPEIDRFIASPMTISNSVKKDFDKRHLENLRNEINADKQIDNYEFRKFKDYSNSRSQVETSDKLSDRKPTNDEIVAALKVLKSAGVSTEQAVAQAQSQPMQTSVQDPTSQNIDPSTYASMMQNPEMAQINMMLGADGYKNNNSSDAMLNMLPYMAAQSRNGTDNYTPQMMQAVIMNSMLNSMNFNIDNNSDKNQ